MKRKDFLTTISGGIASVCVACLSVSCSKDSMNDPTVLRGAELLKIDLNIDLKNIGSFVNRGSFVVVRKSTQNLATSFNAVDLTCPHLGATVNYLDTRDTFSCPKCPSIFSGDGTFLQGLGFQGLKKLEVELKGTTLTVKV